MATKSIGVSIIADIKDLQKGLATAEGDVKSFGAEADKQADKASRSFDGIGESADHMASSSAQAAGGLGDLGGALGLLPGPLGALGAGMEAAAPAIMGVTGAADLLNLATEKFPILAKLAAAGQWLVNIAMSAFPAILVIAGLVAIGAAFVILWKKSQTFRDIVTGVWNAVKAGAQIAWNFIKGIFNLWTLQYRLLWMGAVAAKDLIVAGFNKLVSFFGNLKGRFSFGGMFDGIKDAFKAAINWIIDKWNGLSFTIPSIDTHIPGVGKVGGFSLNTPNIPRLAKGGITNGPTLALIGDNPSGREAVVPLDGNNPFGNVYYISVNAGAWGNPVAAAKEIQSIIAAGASAGVRVVL